ncbi:hypothetical protein ACO02O_02966 [Dirofilaria immitis]
MDSTENYLKACKMIDGYIWCTMFIFQLLYYPNAKTARDKNTAFGNIKGSYWNKHRTMLVATHPRPLETSYL